MAASLSFLAVGCARSPAAVDWSRLAANTEEGIIAYAAATNIAIYDPHKQAVVATLRGHTQPVNAVRWFRCIGGSAGDVAPPHRLQLVSAAGDRQIIVWEFDTITYEYNIIGRLLGHEDGVSCVTALRVYGDSAESSYSLIASTAADLTVRIWMHSIHPSPLVGEDAPPQQAGGWQCIQVLSNGRHKIMHTVDLAYIPIPASTQAPSSALLALSVGGVDSKIHIWFSGGASSSSIDFVRGVSLSGHENWIRSLEWAQIDHETEAMAVGSSAKESIAAPLVSLMLASASQDKHIRLWKLQVGRPAESPSDDDSNDIVCTSLGSRGHIISYRGFSLLLVLESVLSGHDNWVLSARWQPAVYTPQANGTLTRHQPMCILSASTDKSMCIWRPTSSVWHSDVKVGEMGGHTLGFYGCAFSPDGRAILANGYSGSFHLWRAGDAGAWNPAVTISGHAGSVNDLCWDARGDYLLSTGSDQTTRLWAPWQEHKIDVPVIAAQASAPAAAAESTPTCHSRPSWHEISRPQLHGYDLNCLCPIYDPDHSRAHSIASGADEKVVRVFWAPQPFLDTVKRIAGVETIESSNAAERPLIAPLVDETRTLEGGGGEDEDGEGDMKLSSPSPPPIASAPANSDQLAFLESQSSRAIKANLPELGLSNKALMDGDAANNMRGMSHVQEVMSGASQLSVGAPPPEDYLLSTTLWPEVEKLYGHGYEIISIACSYDGTLLASACVSKKATHAVIRVWQTRDWTEILQLEAHRSSVVTLAFSPDGRYLLSGSKDRHVCVFDLDCSGDRARLSGSCKLRVHSRIVWSVDWAPSRLAHYFASASRDKTVKCFRVTGEPGKPTIVEDFTFPPFACAATAVAFAPLAPRRTSEDDLFPQPESNQTRLTIAIGLEDGRIEIWRSGNTADIQTGKYEFTRLYALPIKSEQHKIISWAD